MTHQAATLAQKAGGTRSRRAKAGNYPTREQRAAFRKFMQRDGFELLTKEDMLVLSTHPHLTQSQRSAWATAAARQRD